MHTHVHWPLHPIPPQKPWTSTSTHHVHKTQNKKHTQLHSMSWKCTPTDTQLPLFSYHHCSNPSRLLSHSLRLSSVQFGFYSALGIPDAQPFTIRLTVINYHHHHYYHDASTSKASSKPCHPGDLSHGIKILFWCFHVQTTANDKDNCLTLALICELSAAWNMRRPAVVRRLCTRKERDFKVTVIYNWQRYLGLSFFIRKNILTLKYVYALLWNTVFHI